MLFNSWNFALFFFVVYLSYLLIRNYRWQNVLLLCASYTFYAAWDWRFCFLMAASTVVDYCCGLGFEKYSTRRARLTLLWISILTNLGALAFFKYCNFFLGNLESLLAPFGTTVGRLHLDIILPVGISFYTFQAMSYSIDIYKGEMKPTRNLLDFALFVSFFPQLVAGPIERAKVLLEQIARPRTIDERMFASGCWLIFWGLWKKILVADNLAQIADPLFASSSTLTATESYLAVVAFAFQIYCDFSAYSDIARGTARLMGFELMLNFNCPYAAVSPSDFWRRWHISLSTWLRDYLYIPLGGNRGSTYIIYRNLLLTMTLGGLWHGAAWNFVWWGVYHGLILCAWRLLASSQREEQPATPLRHAWAVFVMFQFTLFGWLLFRCNRTITLPNGTVYDDSFRQIIEMVTAFRNGLGLNVAALRMCTSIAIFVVPLLSLEWLARNQEKLEEDASVLPRAIRIVLTSGMLFTMLFWGVRHAEEFIYFQF